jgi:hypothetical protein
VSAAPVSGYEIAAAGVHVSLDRDYALAALRYFDAGLALTEPLVAALGSALAAVPKALQAVIASRAGAPLAILAWRGVSETLLLCRDARQLTALEAAVGPDAQSSVVDLTGAFWVWVVSGARAADLIARLGSVTAVPTLGSALGGRLAEVSVMSLCVEPGKILLIVDRLYADHLFAWMRETLADF